MLENAILSTNTYGANNGLLKQVEYGNGYQVKYDHNQWGQPTYIFKNSVRITTNYDTIEVSKGLLAAEAIAVIMGKPFVAPVPAF